MAAMEHRDRSVNPSSFLKVDTNIQKDPKGRNDQKNFSTKSHFSAEPIQFQNQQHVSKTSIAFHHLRCISRCFKWWNKKKTHLIPCPTRCPNSFFAKPMPAVMNSLSRDSWSKTPRKCPLKSTMTIWFDGISSGFNGCEWDFNGIYHDANGILMGFTWIYYDVNGT